MPSRPLPEGAGLRIFALDAERLLVVPMRGNNPYDPVGLVIQTTTTSLIDAVTRALEVVADPTMKKFWLRPELVRHGFPASLISKGGIQGSIFPGFSGGIRARQDATAGGRPYDFEVPNEDLDACVARLVEMLIAETPAGKRAKRSSAK